MRSVIAFFLPEKEKNPPMQRKGKYYCQDETNGL
jgi:hypothetical protein